MLAKSIDELNRIRGECYGAVTKRAALSGGAAIIPLPGIDVAADVGLLLQLIPEINHRFGLSPEQIDQYSAEQKTFIAKIITDFGSKLVGRVITKELVILVLKKVGIRVTAKEVVKWVPIIGQAVAGTISFTAMKFLGNQHVNECYEIAKRLVEKPSDGT